VKLYFICLSHTYTSPRTKARHVQGEVLKELNCRWNTVHDLCTMTAYNSAFEDCREGDGYDIGELHLLLVMDFTNRSLYKRRFGN
jgi:hypothetical protein